MKTEHLHIGPGSLGLGLIVDTANQAGIHSKVVGYRKSELAGGREAFAVKPTGGPRKPLKASYCEAANFDALSDEVKQVVLADIPVLLTTALGAGGLSDASDLIVEIASNRPRTGHANTCFIPCENNPGNDYPKLERELRRLGVECRRTMVNRLCPEREPDRTGRFLVVKVDPYAEWMIEGPADLDSLSDINRVDHVSFVDDIEPFAVRKKWLVNGSHLALALIARASRRHSVRAVARQKARQGFLERLQAAMVEALPAEWRNVLPESIDYACEQVISWCRTQDRAERILSRLRRSDLRPFFEDLEHKLIAPARAYRKKYGELPGEFGDVLEALHVTMLTFSNYVDAKEIHRNEVRLSTAVDRGALAAYQTVLAGLVDVEVADLRIHQLAAHLERDLMAYG